MSKRINLHQRTQSLIAFPEDLSIYDTPPTIVDDIGATKASSSKVDELKLLPPKPPASPEGARVKAGDKKLEDANAASST